MVSSQVARALRWNAWSWRAANSRSWSAGSSVSWMQASSRARAAALYDSVEAQIVEWANDIHAGDDLEIVFESFHDLME
jgi:hypothetical protein